MASAYAESGPDGAGDEVQQRIQDVAATIAASLSADDSDRRVQNITAAVAESLNHEDPEVRIQHINGIIAASLATGSPQERIQNLSLQVAASLVGEPGAGPGFQELALAPQPAPLALAQPHESGGEAPPTSLPIYIDVLQHLRVEVQTLVGVWERMLAGEISAPPYAGFIEQTVQQADELLEAVAGSGGPALHHIYTTWRQICISPLVASPAQQLEGQELLRQLTALLALGRRMLAEIGRATIPLRIKEWLRQARPGYSLPFHAIFKDELPGPEDRMALLRDLTWGPNALPGGLVDPGSGLIYRYDPLRAGRRRRHWLLLGGLGLATLLISSLSLLPIWPFGMAALPAALVSWLALLAGMIGHIGVATLKRSQLQAVKAPLLSASDLPLFIEAKAGVLGLKIVLAALVCAVLIMSGLPGVALSLLAGYVLDSLIDLFGATIDKHASP